VPTEELLETLKQTKDYNKLAKHFNVSQIIIARKLYDLNLINENDFIEFLQENAKKERKSINKECNFYETIKLRLSKRFISLLKSAIYENIITYKDGMLVTELKRGSFFKLIEEDA
jgi:Zn-dependent peptidase ImmA (M78 family)